MKKEVDSRIDGHKIHLHPEKVAQWLQTGDCYPIHIEIGATSRCNQNCIFCALDFARGKSDINGEIMTSALEDMAKQGVKSVMFGGEGEPLLHKDLGLFVERARGYGLDVALTTNGVAFNRKLQEQCLPYLSWVKFSVDAGTAEAYNIIHGVSTKHFERLFQNIFDSTELKKRDNLDVVIGTQFLVLPQNANKTEITRVIEELEKIKVDYISIKPYSDHPRSRKELVVSHEDWEILEETLENLKEKANLKIIFRKETRERIGEGHKYQECYGLHFISLIDSKGDVIPCNLFYDMPEYTYGNLYKQSFREIWEGNQRKKVLEELRIKGVEKCRRGCRCDAGNYYLERLKKPQPHDNFT